MRGLVCRLVGHKPALAPFSGTAVRCARCGTDLGGHPRGPVLPMAGAVTPKAGGAARFPRWPRPRG